jgi:hypothetical protein
MRRFGPHVCNAGSIFPSPSVPVVGCAWFHTTVPNQVFKGSDVVVGLDSPDDCAIVRAAPTGPYTVHTVDYFRYGLSSFPSPVA